MNRYVSIGNILAKFIREVGLKETDVTDIDSLIEWAIEAESQMSGGFNLLRKQVELPINNFKVILPCDTQEVLAVFFNGIRLTSYLGNFPKAHLTRPLADFQYAYSTDNECLYLMFDAQGQTVKVEYQGLNIDEDGFPMVLNTVYHRSAIVAYMRWKFEDARTTDINVVEYRRNQWRMERSAAIANDAHPTIDQIETMVRGMRRLKPNLRQWGTRNGFGGMAANDAYTTHN